MIWREVAALSVATHIAPGELMDTPYVVLAEMARLIREASK